MPRAAAAAQLAAESSMNSVSSAFKPASSSIVLNISVSGFTIPISYERNRRSKKSLMPHSWSRKNSLTDLSQWMTLVLLSRKRR